MCIDTAYLLLDIGQHSRGRPKKRWINIAQAIACANVLRMENDVQSGNDLIGNLTLAYVGTKEKK